LHAADRQPLLPWVAASDGSLAHYCQTTAAADSRIFPSARRNLAPGASRPTGGRVRCPCVQ